MGKLIDITDKLSFEGNPRLRIRDTELEVNADAATIVKVLALLREGSKSSMENVLEAAKLMFTQEEQAKLDALGLSFTDYSTVLTQAMAVAMGNEGQTGESKTRTMI